MIITFIGLNAYDLFDLCLQSAKNAINKLSQIHGLLIQLNFSLYSFKDIKYGYF
jgi:hypothetical protein